MTRKRTGRAGRPGWCRIFQDEDGTTALEFALVAPLLFLVLFSIFAFGFVLFARGALDNGTNQAVRAIRLGTPQNFPTVLCNEVKTLMSCNGLSYYVQSGSSFGALHTGIETDSNGNLVAHDGSAATAYPQVPPNTGTSSGAAIPAPYMIVQVGYKINLVNGLVAKLAGVPNGLLLVSTAVFENEPYPA